jgi:hypothetical protein
LNSLISRDIPVQRQSAVIALRLGRSFVFDADNDRYIIRHAATAQLKGRGSSITVYTPVTWTTYFQKWIQHVRPVLLKDPGHDYLFVSKTGEPLKSLSKIVAKTLQEYYFLLFFFLFFFYFGFGFEE